MHFTTALIAGFAATNAAARTLPFLSGRGSSPIVPPNNPPSNGPSSGCSSRTQCLQMINNVRSDQEGLNPIVLPSNWHTMTREERLFTFINLERTSRGLGPCLNLVNSYTSELNTAITNDEDPVPPSSVTSWGSIWAGGGDMIPLAAMYLWMYYDGPGGSNEDCTSSDSSGCWGHRDIILGDYDGIDVGAGTDSSGSTGYAAIFFSNSSPGDVVMTWDHEKTKLAS